MSRRGSARHRRRAGTWALVATALAMCAASASGPASALGETQYGTLSNFDTFNDTGEETHGFEIELDGVSSADISYEFGAPYERYGNPKLVDFPGGVYVRYESPWDPVAKAFTEGTPIASSPITPTLGHQCWTGGSIEYLTSGCEHFGLGLIKNPTNTVYRWLVADPEKPGSLRASGTNVSIPAPEWKVNPPSPEKPAGGVEAVINAPQPEAFQEFGEAEWVKVYVTESPNPAELNHLLTDDPAVPEEESETEIEWKMIQKENGAPNSGEVASERPLEGGAESVTRRYELYQYTGPYDHESHEAIPANEDSPAPGEVGEYLGAQMAALNILAGEPAPTVGKLSVKKGPAAGGTSVTITGTGFTGAAAVRFGSNDATGFTVNSATSITAVSPPGTTGVSDLSVTTPNGTSGAFPNDVFKYGNPTVTSVSPATGPSTGETSVTVTGSGFAPGPELTVLKFGKSLGSLVECPSSTTCMVVAPPAKKAGTVDVRARAGGKTSSKSSADHYAYF